MSAIHTETLANGLCVAIERIPGMSTVSLCWLVPVGTAGDAPEQEGATTLLSELILRGAGTRDSRTWSDALDALGCERRTTANPFHTLLTATLMGNRLADAFPLLADAILRPRLDPEHLDPVQKLALQALDGLSDDPQHLVMLRLAQRFLPAPYNRTGYGTHQGLRGATMSSLRSSWAARAVPTGSILVIAGAVEPSIAMGVIRRSLEAWAGGTQEPSVVSAAIGGSDHLVQDSSQTHLAIALPAPVDADPDSNALRLASMVLGGESSSRLFTEVREKRGLCYSVGASVSLGRDRGMLQVYAGSTPERAGQTLTCIRGELERFGGGISADEFERARTGLKARVVMQGESAAARASSVAGDLFRMKRARTLDDMAAAFDALTLDRVNAAITRHWGRGWTDRMVLASIGPAPLEPSR